MTGTKPILILLFLLVATTVTACGEETADPGDRGPAVVELCKGHDGVAALEDDLVVCGDQTYHQAPQ